MRQFSPGRSSDMSPRGEATVVQVVDGKRKGEFTHNRTLSQPSVDENEGQLSERMLTTDRDRDDSDSLLVNG